MEIKNVLVTGESLFLERYQFLFKALSAHVENLYFLPRKEEWYESTFPRIAIKSLLSIFTSSLSKANAVYQKNSLAFAMKSKQTENEIKKLGYSPDIIFHFFATYSPVWDNLNIPYVLYLDYTTALAERQWKSWAYFINSKHHDDWFNSERRIFSNAKYLFCMNHVTQKSLIEDYKIEDDKITVVGASGDFSEPLAEPKIFGSKQILFNGSDFERKGGDIVLSAFEIVKKIIPEAKLVFIGKKLSFTSNGIINLGHISRKDIHGLFQTTDLVIAPARCDPFPAFLMEAMNYGIPCIISANDGMPEMIEHGVNGVVIEKPTPETLADQIVNLLNKPDLLTSMSHAAKDKVRYQLSWENVAKKIANVICDS